MTHPLFTGYIPILAFLKLAVSLVNYLKNRGGYNFPYYYYTVVQIY